MSSNIISSGIRWELPPGTITSMQSLVSARLIAEVRYAPRNKAKAKSQKKKKQPYKEKEIADIQSIEEIGTDTLRIRLLLVDAIQQREFSFTVKARPAHADRFAKHLKKQGYAHLVTYDSPVDLGSRSDFVCRQVGWAAIETLLKLQAKAAKASAAAG